MKSVKIGRLIKDTLVIKDVKSFIVFSPFTGKITRIDKFPEPKSALYDKLCSVGFFKEAPLTTVKDNRWNGFSTLTLLTTRRCNLSCVYCSSSAVPNSADMPISPLDNIEKIIYYLRELGVKKIHLEPLFPYGRLYQNISFGRKNNQLIYPPESKEFSIKFLEALDVAKKCGIEIRNSHLINFRKGNGYFCGAASARAMVVTHDGFLTGCLEVVDIKDPDANTFILGKYSTENHDFEINHDMISTMQKRHADYLIQCKDCYARYNCAGGCAIKAVRATNDFFEKDVSYCNFTKALIPYLVKRIANASGV